MNTDTDVTEAPTGPVVIRAHRKRSKRFGDWTNRSSFDIRASGAVVVLDLLLPQIEPGEIDVSLELERATVKLLVPHGAHVDDGELRRIGRSKVKDWTGAAEADGRRIVLRGELRRSEVRIVRGGMAIWTLWLAGRRREVDDAHAEGRV